MITEKQFGAIFHMREALKFNRLHLLFKHILRWCPILIFLWFAIHNYYIVIPLILVVGVFSWLASVKMKSLRDVNIYAARQLRNEYLSETFR